MKDSEHLKWIHDIEYVSKKGKIKPSKSKSLKIFGLRFEIWKVIQGYRLSVDTKTTRYVFRPFWYVSKCEVTSLI